MIRLLSRGWRNDLADVALSANRSIVVAAPYIKQDEAVWFCGLLRPGIEVVTLANVDAEAISVAALDLAALRCFAEASPSATTTNTSSSKANVTAGPGNADWRHAQQHLKRKGIVTYDPGLKTWALSEPESAATRQRE